MSAVASDGLGRIERFELARADPATPSVVFQRLTDEERPETLQEIAKSMGFPRGLFVEWFTTEHAERYDAALKVLGDGLGQAVKKMTDDATPENLALMKFKTDRYLRLAGHLNPERYSPRTEMKHTGLQPTLVIEIAAPVADEGGRVVEGAVVAEAPPKLPARAVDALATIPANERVHELI